MNEEPTRNFDQIFSAEIRPVCPRCGPRGFIVLREDAIVNADKDILIVTCESKSCHAAIGVLPASAVWDENFRAHFAKMQMPFSGSAAAHHMWNLSNCVSQRYCF